MSGTDSQLAAMARHALSPEPFGGEPPRPVDSGGPKRVAVSV